MMDNTDIRYSHPQEEHLNYPNIHHQRRKLPVFTGITPSLEELLADQDTVGRSIPTFSATAVPC